MWKALVRSFNEWIEQPDRIPEWVTHGRTVLLPKLEDLSDEKEYRPITCLNTCYKIFTGNIGSYMKEHAERNSIWDRSQLGTCSGVLGTVDQLIVDNTIMDEVRGKGETLLLHSMITARHTIWLDMTGCYEFIDGWECQKKW